MFLWQRGCAKTRLRCAGDRRPDGLRGLELGQVRDEVPAKRGDIDDEEFFGGGHAVVFSEGRLEEHENGKWPAIGASRKLLAKSGVRAPDFSSRKSSSRHCGSPARGR